MIRTIFDGHDELYHRAQFGDGTTHAGCRCENVVFFVCHAPSPEHRAFKGCIVRTRIAYRLQTNFDVVYSFFLRRDCSFRCITQFSYRRQLEPQFSRNWGQKLRKVQKSAEKVLRNTSYRYLTDLKKTPPHQFSAENVDVHLCNSLPQVGIQRRQHYCQISYRQSNKKLS